MGAGILVFFGLAIAVYLLVAPLAAFVFAVRANRRNEDLLLRIHALEHRVAELSGQRDRAALAATAQSLRGASALGPGQAAQAGVTPLAVAPPAADAGTAGAFPAVDAGAAGAFPAVEVSAAGAPPAITAEEAGALAAVDVSAAGAFPAGDVGAAGALAAAFAGAGAPPALAQPGEASDAVALSTAAPAALAGEIGAPPAVAPPDVAAPAERRPAGAVHEGAFGAGALSHRGAPERPSIEEQLGITWLTRAGAATFLLGALFFFKYASDNAWIGPTGRVAIGAATGAALLGVAEAIRGRTQRRFVHALIGLGLAVLIASVWAGAVLYELIPISAAFAAETALLLLGAALALRHRGEAILLLSLVAGFLNPVVLSTGQDRPLVLFGYLLLMTSVVHAVAAKLGFRVAPWLALAGHTALFSGWYDRYFDASAPPVAGAVPDAAPWLDQPAEALAGPYLPLAARAVPLAFVALAA
ncbi:MAG TPA: DUF2339 domain-containing protein, partial [Sorangium sp.]|nr:DUF2339 domain-containing protein [Sorangium sp.]